MKKKRAARGNSRIGGKSVECIKVVMFGSSKGMNTQTERATKRKKDQLPFDPPWEEECPENPDCERLRDKKMEVSFC